MFGLKDGVDPQLALDQILVQTSAISQISTSGVSTTDLLQNYFRWVESARRGLRSAFEGTAVRRLVETDHYWFLRGATDRNVRVIPAVVDELEERTKALELLRDEIATERAHWGHADPYLIVVPDTSMLMSKSPKFADYDWCEITKSREWLRLVLPLQVIDELDGLKDRGANEQKRTARSMIKWLDERLEASPRDAAKLALPNTATHVTLEVVTPIADAGYDNDMTIVETARQLSQIAVRPSMVVSRDLGQTVRGRVIGQDCEFVHTPLDAP